jgi:hypothetical protein
MCSTAWNAAQALLMERLSEVASGTLDAFLVATITLENDQRFYATIKGGASRHIDALHPAHAILSKEGVGFAATPEQAITAALGSY